jgi:pyruvate-formate lyase-activating enzyme
VDKENRQDLRFMSLENVRQGVRRARKIMPKNRLREHLEACALVYSCPAGKNFFLSRYEAPLPTSQHCNARCLGCISLQNNTGIPNTQNRITFTPTPEEIAEIAVYHIKRVRHSIVSFGQGCEGDPLLAADVIEPAIRLIRSQTSDGTINMNTNGSLPDILDRLFQAGLDSIRISVNSVRKECYDAYFRPAGYSFPDVLESIDRGIAGNKLTSINYLNSPGFTDAPEEMAALCDFLRRHPIHLIQWRNLNFDPKRYWEAMKHAAPDSKPVGMPELLRHVRTAFPNLKHGYFNPPKEKYA